jgi:ribulose-5-phosphate 4-epimerase/fuculose-1-phosphate aldolase
MHASAFWTPRVLQSSTRKAGQTSGDRASKTIALHMRIYAAARKFDANTACVIHTHSTHCVALTLNAPQDELLPALTPYFVMKVGHVPVIAYHRPGAPEAAEQVAQAIERFGNSGMPIRAVMLTRLGPNVWHDTPGAAMSVLEELEETARLQVLTQAALPAPLDADQIDELRRTFGARW